MADVGATIGLAAGVATVLTFLLEAIKSPVRRRWTRWRTPARTTAALRQLTCGVQIAYFHEILHTEPQFRNVRSGSRTEDSMSEHVFVLQHAYVQAVTDDNSTVVAFAVSTRSARYHPRLDYYPSGSIPRLGPVILGRTTYVELNRGSRPEGVFAFRGNRPWTYVESHYTGNPGHYLYYLFGTSNAAPAVLKEPPPLAVSFGIVFGERTEAEGADWLDTDEASRWRSASTINTCGVVQRVDHVYREGGFMVGPNLDQVRLLPGG